MLPSGGLRPILLEVKALRRDYAQPWTAQSKQTVVTIDMVSSTDVLPRAQHNVFAELDETEYQHLANLGHALQLPPGAVLYREGDSYRRELFLLLDGQLSVARQRRATQHPEPGFLLGVSSYFTESPYSATVAATSAVTVRRIRHDELEQLEQSRPAIHDALNRMIASRLDRARVKREMTHSAIAVRNTMSTPVLCIDAEQSLAGALRQMLSTRVGSVQVNDTQQLVTYESASRCVLDRDTPPSKISVREAAQDVPSISADAPLWQAQALEHRTKSRYLLVKDDTRTVGIVSSSDLLRALGEGNDALRSRIANVERVDDLRPHYDAIYRLANELLTNSRHATRALRALSNAHLAIQQRVIELTLQDIADNGHGAPPGPFALMIMGSGGRREMMLDPDQDNGLIIHDALADSAAASQWFTRFAHQLNVNFDIAGYVLCPGDIMARNPSFHKSLKQWTSQIDYMTERPNERAARWSSIMFDFDTQYGDASLTGMLRNHINQRLATHPRLLQYMVADDAEGRAPLNWFNQLVATGEKGGHEVVDIKRNGLRMVANAARIMALRSAVHSLNTGDRLADLARLGVLSHDFVATVVDAYDELQGILLMHQIRQRQDGTKPDKEVSPDALTPPQRESLRIAMRAVKRLQETLQNMIGLP